MLVTLTMMMALAASDPSPAVASPTPPEPPRTLPAPAPRLRANSDPNELICEHVAPIGSAIPRRVCKTRAQWDRRAHDDQYEMRRVQDAGGVIVE